MKLLNRCLKYSLVFFPMILFMGCEPDEQIPADYYDNSDFTVKLSADKSVGKGQYIRKVESGNEVNVVVRVQSASALSALKITKTVNLAVDPTYGNNGSLIIDASGTSFEYDFNYLPDTNDVDQLVGFAFEATNAVGESKVSDLTLAVTMSPRDNLPRRRWMLTSILHVNENNLEVIKECELDNAILLNADSTMVMDYGDDTAEGDCAFDGFKVYEKWYLTEDEEQFVWEYSDLFDPAKITAETYAVKLLTTEEIRLELTVDLTELGLGIETYLYIYKAAPR